MHVSLPVDGLLDATTSCYLECGRSLDPWM